MAHAHHGIKRSTLRLVALILIVAALALLLLFSNRQVASQGQTSILNSYGTRSVTPEPFGRAGVTPLPWRRGVAPRGVTPEPFGRNF